MKQYDRIIIGAGFYGMYSAVFCCKRGQSVLVLECDQTSFGRATYINQARVHHGYHYPRSLSTALKSAGYFARFSSDFAFCINKKFDKVYATSRQYSWSDGKQFNEFCRAANIPCEELNPNRFFQKNICDSAFLTKEYTYDAAVLKKFYLEQLEKCSSIEIQYEVNIVAIEKETDYYVIRLANGSEYRTGFVLNAAYAGTNQILSIAGFDLFKIKYELCEIILCDVNERLAQFGFTVMDGPFFSIMPFGMTRLHSLTSVTFTPHAACLEEMPLFSCQKKSLGHCSSSKLANCNNCPCKPATAFPYMAGLAKKYLREEYGFRYHSSLFSMKPILLSSEIDDSRPTVIKIYSRQPTFIGVLSGKINTVYDLDEVLSDE